MLFEGGGSGIEWDQWRPGPSLAWTLITNRQRFLTLSSLVEGINEIGHRR